LNYNERNGESEIRHLFTEVALDYRRKEELPLHINTNSFKKAKIIRSAYNGMGVG